jgi:Cu2+-exporting ATPase
MAVHGVTDVHARPLTASLLVHFDPASVDSAQLVVVVDSLVSGPAPESPPVIHPPAVEFGLANASVGLAAAGELAIPALLPASAVLLVVSNATVIRTATRELLRRQLGLPVLYTAIVAGTLGTGHFLVAAAMTWMFKYWRHRHRRDQLQLRRRLLPSLSQRPLLARRTAGGNTVSIRTDRLRSGDRIIVDEGETVPVDGRLLSGPAVVDERHVTGALGLTRKQPGDAIFAGSRSLSGMLEIEASKLGGETRAARLGHELAAAAIQMPTDLSLTAHGEAFARRAVAPTLAAAGVGLLFGDLTTASAILRPDYATGPGLGASALLLRHSALCAEGGVILRDATAFERLAASDIVIFDDDSALENGGLEIDRIEGEYENTLLQLAATAFRDIADERSIAMLAACRSRGIPLLAIEPRYRGSSIVVEDGAVSVTLDDARTFGAAPSGSPLFLAANGRTVGRIFFRQTSESRLAGAVEALRHQGGVAIGLFSAEMSRTAEPSESQLKPDFHHAGLSSSAKADLLRSCRNRGLKIAYVGDCRREPQAAREAHVAISVAGDFDPDHDPAQILVLRNDFTWLPALCELSRTHAGRVQRAQNLILVPNLVCIAGAFFLGFTSLWSVVITNLGTWAIYAGLIDRQQQRLEHSRSAPTLIP